MIPASKFSPEQIRAEQIRQIQEEGLRFYYPGLGYGEKKFGEPYSAQLEFSQSQADERAFSGANQVGKSWAGRCEVALTVGKIHPWRSNYVGTVAARDCCVTYKTIKQVLIPTYKRILPRRACKLGWKTYEGRDAYWPGLKGGTWDTAWNEQDKILLLEDGSFIEFMSYEQGREAFQGARRHIIAHDEEPPQDIYSENLARQLTTRRNIIFTFTPLNYSLWLYRDIYERSATDDNVFFVKATVYDSPYINHDMIEAIENTCTDDAMRAARLYGDFTVISGRVLKDYGDHNAYDPFPIPSEWNRSVVIDPHLDKNTAVTWIAEDFSGKLYVYDEAWLEGEVKDICNEIAIRSAGQRIDLWLIDPSSRQRAKIWGKDKSLVVEFRKYIRSLQLANNNRDIGIDRLRSYVKNDLVNGPKLVVSRDCPRTDFQLRNAMWKEPLKSGEDRRNPEMVKRDDDFFDCVRYRVMAQPDQRIVRFTGFGLGGYAS